MVAISETVLGVRADRRRHRGQCPAGAGAEALRLVRSEQPDLVLIDVMIPRVNGLDACQEITQDPNTRLIPAVLIRSLNDSASRIPGMDVGADDFLSKPFNAHEFRTRVRWLRRK